LYGMNSTIFLWLGFDSLLLITVSFSTGMIRNRQDYINDKNG